MGKRISQKNMVLEICVKKRSSYFTMTVLNALDPSTSLRMTLSFYGFPSALHLVEKDALRMGVLGVVI